MIANLEWDDNSAGYYDYCGNIQLFYRKAADIGQSWDFNPEGVLDPNFDRGWNYAIQFEMNRWASNVVTTTDANDKVTHSAAIGVNLPDALYDEFLAGGVEIRLVFAMTEGLTVRLKNLTFGNEKTTPVYSFATRAEFKAQWGNYAYKIASYFWGHPIYERIETINHIRSIKTHISEAKALPTLVYLDVEEDGITKRYYFATKERISADNRLKLTWMWGTLQAYSPEESYHSEIVNEEVIQYGVWRQTWTLLYVGTPGETF